MITIGSMQAPTVYIPVQIPSDLNYRPPAINPSYIPVQEYVPASGPLALGFKAGHQYKASYAGAIAETIIKDKQLLNEFATAIGIDCKHVANMLQRGQIRYQELVEQAREEKHDSAYKALLVFEKALVKLHHHYAYICTMPKGWLSSAVFTGIRNPFNGDITKQIIKELEQLATVAQIHYPATAIRMYTRIGLIKNWKTTSAIASAATATVAMKIAPETTKTIAVGAAKLAGKATLATMHVVGSSAANFMQKNPVASGIFFTGLGIYSVCKLNKAKSSK